MRPETIQIINGVEVHWGEIAFNEEHLWAKLDGEMAEITMPERAWPVRFWRKIFPWKSIECKPDGTTYLLKS